jgi:hypothetical protein
MSRPVFALIHHNHLDSHVDIVYIAYRIHITEQFTGERVARQQD